MTVSIELKNVSVYGVDTHARAATLRQCFARRGSMKPVRVPILHDVTFHAKPGDRIGIVGVNGSGKSSMLKVITGNYPIHAGYRHVEGTIVPLIEMGAGFEPEVTGRNNIELTYAYRGKLRQFNKEVEEKIISFAEIGEHIDRPLKTYSSGMIARLAFSTAIFQDPEILILDEILAAGDGGFIRKSLDAVMDKVNKAAITIVVTHSIDEMVKICNRYVLMHKGTIINEGTAEEIIPQYEREILKREPSYLKLKGDASVCQPL